MGKYPRNLISILHFERAWMTGNREFDVWCDAVTDAPLLQHGVGYCDLGQHTSIWKVNPDADEAELRTKENFYFKVILWSTFALSSVRFLGVSSLSLVYRTRTYLNFVFLTVPLLLLPPKSLQMVQAQLSTHSCILTLPVVPNCRSATDVVISSSEAACLLRNVPIFNVLLCSVSLITNQWTS